MNWINGKDFVIVTTQVIYTSIIGFYFAILFIVSKRNLLLCGVIHSLYDVASGLGDFHQPVSGVVEDAQQMVDYAPYFENVCLFLPLFAISCAVLIYYVKKHALRE